MSQFKRRDFFSTLGLAAAGGYLGASSTARAAPATPPAAGGGNGQLGPDGLLPGRPIMPPWSAIDDFPLLADDRALRIRNRATVEKYLSLAGRERIDRWMLFTQDAQTMTEGFYTEPGAPRPDFMNQKGRDFVRTMDAVNVDNFPDWCFYNNIIFETEDPNLIIVEGDGSGMSYLKKDNPVRHSDHYFHVFRMVEGRISAYSEVRNELREIREWGWKPDLPKFPRYEAMFEQENAEDAPYIPAGQDNPALRARNIGTIRTYLGCKGKNCADRWRLFTQDGSSGPGYTGDGRILRARGLDRIRKAEGLRASAFPDWSYSDLQLHQTTDPAYFVAHVIGEGLCTGYAARPFFYKEHFYYSFLMRDGKIAAVREYGDPQKWATLTGWDMHLPAG